MDYKLHDFLPLYNDIQTTNFDKDTNSLSEFVQYKLPREEVFPRNPGDLMLHQKLISTFINPHTQYNGLLLVHEMGTGKTCTAVSVAEEFIQSRGGDKDETFPSSTVKKIIVLTKGKGLQSNFINEVANVCTKGQYLEGLDKYLKNRDKKIRRNVKVNYTFDTFEIFAKNLKKMSDREKTITYENSLFIVDEAHNLRITSDAEESGIYYEIYGLFELLKNRKILLLTGTPMKDKPEEIIDLLNLILPRKLTIDDLSNVDLFKSKINGYVSYLRAMMSDVNRKEEGEMIGTLTHFKVYPVVMDKFQAEVYLSAKKKDDEERSIFNHSRQTSSFIFPDKSYGKAGFEKNIIQTSTGYRFENSVVREKLRKDLNKYSAKYNNLLEKLQEDFESGRSSFVFSEFVKGSGLVVLSLLLELNGYIRATGSSNFNKPAKRYAIFTNDTSTDSQTRQLISVFNNPKNMKGEYISTILGSRVIMEGFSFKNIQSEYILTPHWNYSETSQIIARGLRLGSHNDLIKSGIVPEVKIYHYVSLPTPNKLKDSIDLHMYEIAETKDLQIQKVIRTLKEAAFDCELNKDRNTIINPNLNNTRSCEYTECEYKCDNSFNQNFDPKRTNDRNYRLLYFRVSKDYINLKNFIIQRVLQSPFSIEEIVSQTKYSEFEVLCVLQDLLDNSQVLFSRPEGSYYLSKIKNLYFANSSGSNLSNDSSGDPQLLDFYSKYTTIFMGKSIDELVYQHQKNFMVTLVHKIFESKNLIELQKYVVQLPIYLQEKLLTLSLSSLSTSIKNNFVRDMVLNNFRLYYRIDGNKAYVWLNTDNYKCNSTIENSNSWRLCNTSEQRLIENMKKERTQAKVENNPYGYIGLLNRTSNDFCLRKLDDDMSTSDKRKRNVGKRCQNWKKHELVDLVSNRLKINPDDDFDFDDEDVTKMKADPKFQNILNSNNGTLRDYKRVAFWNAQGVDYLCSRIMQNFMDEKLVVDDPNCGTSKKIR